MSEREDDVSWKDILSKYGVAGAIALGLTYTLAVTLNTTIKEARDTANKNTVLIEQHISATAPLASQVQSLVNLQLQTCANAADNASKRSKCFESVYTTPTRQGQ